MGLVVSIGLMETEMKVFNWKNDKAKCRGRLIYSDGNVHKGELKEN